VEQQPITEFLGAVRCFEIDMKRHIDLKSDPDIDGHLNAYNWCMCLASANYF